MEIPIIPIGQQQQNQDSGISLQSLVSQSMSQDYQDEVRREMQLERLKQDNAERLFRLTVLNPLSQIDSSDRSPEEKKAAGMSLFQTLGPTIAPIMQQMQITPEHLISNLGRGDLTPEQKQTRREESALGERQAQGKAKKATFTEDQALRTRQVKAEAAMQRDALLEEDRWAETQQGKDFVSRQIARKAQEDFQAKQQAYKYTPMHVTKGGLWGTMSELPVYDPQTKKELQEQGYSFATPKRATEIKEAQNGYIAWVGSHLKGIREGLDDITKTVLEELKSENNTGFTGGESAKTKLERGIAVADKLYSLDPQTKKDWLYETALANEASQRKTSPVRRNQILDELEHSALAFPGPQPSRDEKLTTASVWWYVLQTKNDELIRQQIEALGGTEKVQKLLEQITAAALEDPKEAARFLRRVDRR